MRAAKRIGAILAGLAALPALAVAATIGGVYYAPQYDYRDFFATLKFNWTNSYNEDPDGGQNFATKLKAFKTLDFTLQCNGPALLRAKFQLENERRKREGR